MKNLFTLAISAIVTVSTSNGQISINNSSFNYTQDFNTLASTGSINTTVPTGWNFVETGTNANATYNTGTGSSTTGDTYSLGTAADIDRALGTLRTGTLISTIGVQFQNNTGSTINSITLTYTGEQWRCGATGRADRLDFQYSLDATSLTTGTWTDVNDLDFSSPHTTSTGSLDGNASTNKTALSYTISSLSITAGSIFWFRWNDTDATSSDDALAVDDFNISSIALPITLLNFNAKATAKTIDLTWATATELNNNYFSIERSTNGSDFEELTRVQGAGNSTLIRNYSFTDANPANGVNYYRLRQTDFNGVNTASKVVAATLNTAQLNLTVTKNSNNELGLSIEAPEAIQSIIEVTDIAGKVIQKTSAALQKGYNTLTLGSLSQQGMYFVKVTTTTQTVSKKLVF